MLARKKPLARSGFKPAVFGAVRATGKLRSKRMKSASQKMTPIRKSAKGEECTLRIPGVCNGDNSTVVWCHSNNIRDGKGMGLKSRDEEGCYGCSSCHAWIDGGYVKDGPRHWMEQYFDLARAESQAILKRKGLMK
jgi:hypothetical protein